MRAMATEGTSSPSPSPSAGGAVEVRRVRPEESAAAGALVAGVYLAEGYADEQYAAVLRDVAGRDAAGAEVLVAVDGGGRVLGTVTYAEPGSPFADVAAAGEAAFRMLAVAPAARGQGVGEALVRACLARAQSSGHKRMVLSTQPGMRAAHRLYERLGFTRAPERDWSPVEGLRLFVFTRDL